MSICGVMYLLGMFLVLLGERVIGGEDPLRLTFVAVGVLVVLGAFGRMRSQAAGRTEEHRQVGALGIRHGLLGLGGLGLYGLTVYMDLPSTDPVGVGLSVLWPILWLAGSLPFFTVDRALVANPRGIVPSRVRGAAKGALSLALAIAMLFPLNYLGVEHNVRWDHGYFKTARPGTSTLNIVENLDERVQAYLFFPVSSDVTDEIRTYFGELQGEMLEVIHTDHALEPQLSKELKVRDNGYIVLARGEGEDRQVERIKVGTDLDKAKRVLKKLDNEMQSSLLKLAKGQGSIYFTVGHGESSWKSDTERVLKISHLKKVLKDGLRFKVKEVGLADGLATEVPEDATVLVVMGPTEGFLPEELTAIDAFRRKGGSLLVALEPGGQALPELLAPVGLRFDPDHMVAHDSKFVPATRGVIDRLNLITNKFSSHASVTTLSRNSKAMGVVNPGAGVLEELEEGEGKRTKTISSFGEAWADLDGDVSFDAGEESRQVHPMGMAITGPARGGEVDAEGNMPEYRMLVMADATWASDFVLEVSKGNVQLAMDSFTWLGRMEDAQGTVNNEEDVKIQHAREGQAWIFYGTAFFFPFGLFGLGMLRVRSRRKRADGGAQ